MQIVTVTLDTPVGKGSPANTPDIIEVGDNVVVNIQGDDGVWTQVTLEVAYVSNDGKTIGWDRDVALQDYRASDVKGVDETHNREGIFCVS